MSSRRFLVVANDAISEEKFRYMPIQVACPPFRWTNERNNERDILAMVQAVLGTARDAAEYEEGWHEIYIKLRKLCAKIAEIDLDRDIDAQKWPEKSLASDNAYLFDIYSIGQDGTQRKWLPRLGSTVNYRGNVSIMQYLIMCADSNPFIVSQLVYLFGQNGLRIPSFINGPTWHGDEGNTFGRLIDVNFGSLLATPQSLMYELIPTSDGEDAQFESAMTTVRRVMMFAPILIPLDASECDEKDDVDERDDKYDTVELLVDSATNLLHCSAVLAIVENELASALFMDSARRVRVDDAKLSEIARGVVVAFATLFSHVTFEEVFATTSIGLLTPDGNNVVHVSDARHVEQISGPMAWALEMSQKFILIALFAFDRISHNNLESPMLSADEWREVEMDEVEVLYLGAMTAALSVCSAGRMTLLHNMPAHASLVLAFVAQHFYDHQCELPTDSDAVLPVTLQQRRLRRNVHDGGASGCTTSITNAYSLLDREDEYLDVLSESWSALITDAAAEFDRDHVPKDASDKNAAIVKVRKLQPRIYDGELSSVIAYWDEFNKAGAVGQIADLNQQLWDALLADVKQNTFKVDVAWKHPTIFEPLDGKRAAVVKSILLQMQYYLTHKQLSDNGPKIELFDFARNKAPAAVLMKASRKFCNLWGHSAFFKMSSDLIQKTMEEVGHLRDLCIVATDSANLKAVAGKAKKFAVRHAMLFEHLGLASACDFFKNAGRASCEDTTEELAHDVVYSDSGNDSPADDDDTDSSTGSSGYDSDESFDDAKDDAHALDDVEPQDVVNASNVVKGVPTKANADVVSKVKVGGRASAAGAVSVAGTKSADESDDDDSDAVMRRAGKRKAVDSMNKTRAGGDLGLIQHEILRVQPRFFMKKALDDMRVVLDCKDNSLPDHAELVSVYAMCYPELFPAERTHEVCAETKTTVMELDEDEHEQQYVNSLRGDIFQAEWFTDLSDVNLTKRDQGLADGDIVVIDLDSDDEHADGEHADDEEVGRADGCEEPEAKRPRLATAVVQSSVQNIYTAFSQAASSKDAAEEQKAPDDGIVTTGLDFRVFLDALSQSVLAKEEFKFIINAYLRLFSMKSPTLSPENRSHWFECMFGGEEPPSELPDLRATLYALLVADICVNAQDIRYVHWYHECASHDMFQLWEKIKPTAGIINYPDLLACSGADYEVLTPENSLFVLPSDWSQLIPLRLAIPDAQIDGDMDSDEDEDDE